MKTRTFVEIDVDHCSNTYGVSPCTATVNRHNLLGGTSNMGNSDFTKFRVTVNQSVINKPSEVIVPGGPPFDNLADEVVPTSELNTHLLRNTYSITSQDTILCFSCWLKPNGYNWAVLDLSDNNSIKARLLCDLLEGKALPLSGASSHPELIFWDSQKYASGWVRYWFAASGFGDDLTPYVDIRILDNSITFGYSGDTVSSIYVYGPQVTRGVGPGLYTPTDAGSPIDGGGEVVGLCFNSLGTCQDRPNFTNDPRTYRFTNDTITENESIEAIPSLIGVDYKPSVISLGKDLGQRPTLQITFGDHPHNDTPPSDFDHYTRERGYSAHDRGTFWGRFRARNPFLRGRDCRWKQGDEGLSLALLETRHFTIDTFDGPNANGQFTIKAKDPLKLADSLRAQAPSLSSGFLSAGIAAGAGSLTLSPSGIGSTYPASGTAAIGGEEIVTFTRSGDVLTLTARGQHGTDDVAHDADDRVQLCLVYTAQTAAAIIYDLFVNYAGIPASYISLATWESEVASFLNVLYTRVIAEPTAVGDLVSSLIEQAGLAVWWDDLNQKVRLQVLRSIDTSSFTFTEQEIIRGSLRVEEQQDKRVSQVWTYFGVRNPLEDLDDEDNYRSVAAKIDADTELNFGQPMIRKVYGSWIPAFARAVAQRMNDIIIGRFKIPPRMFEFDTYRKAQQAVALGQGYQLKATPFQDATGQLVSIPLQTTSLGLTPVRYVVTAEEMLFDAPDIDLTNRVIIIDSNINNLDLYEIHNSIFPVPTDDDVANYVTLMVIIEEGVIVGSDSPLSPAFDVGTEWPTGFDITIDVVGRIQGYGGGGGNVAACTFEFPIFDCSVREGEDGGTALYTRFPVKLDDGSGEIFGGAGGGGATYTDGQDFAGGGGAGQTPGAAGTGGKQSPSPSEAGTNDQGGQGAEGQDGDGHFVRAGDGGDPGQDGTLGSLGGASGTRYDPGSAGPAIDGVSHVTTISGPGDRRGSQVN